MSRCKELLTQHPLPTFNKPQTCSPLPIYSCWQFPQVAQGSSWSWDPALPGWFLSSCACSWFSGDPLGQQGPWAGSKHESISSA